MTGREDQKANYRFAQDSAAAALARAMGKGTAASLMAKMGATSAASLAGYRTPAATAALAKAAGFSALATPHLKGSVAHHNTTMAKALGTDTVASLMAKMGATSAASLAGYRTPAAPLESVLEVGSRASVRSYADASSDLLRGLGFDDECPLDVEPDLMATEDASTYEAIRIAAPEVADAIDQASAQVRTALWSQEVIRNSMANLVWMIVVTAHIVGQIILPPPLNVLVPNLLEYLATGKVGASTTTADAMKERILRRPDGTSGE